MSGRRDFEWNVVITNFTEKESKAPKKEMIGIVRNTALHSRGTAAMGKAENVGIMLQRKVSG